MSETAGPLLCKWRSEEGEDFGTLTFGPECGKTAAWISCVPFRDTPTCTEHKCRCARPIAQGAAASESTVPAAVVRERHAREAALKLAPLLSLPVLRFALAMQERLDANAHKGDWEEMSDEYLIRRLREETDELVEALVANIPPTKPAMLRVRREAADVANFAMMIADLYGDLHTFDAEALACGRTG